MSVYKNIYGPIWPLGVIVVPTPGTPVSVMSLVDPTNAFAPETQTPAYGNNATTTTSLEYTPQVWSLIFTPIKAAGTANTGVIYIVAKGGSKADTGSIIAILRPTDPPLTITSNSQSRVSFSPYYFLIDANSANDACVVTATVV